MLWQYRDNLSELIFLFFFYHATGTRAMEDLGGDGEIIWIIFGHTGEICLIIQTSGRIGEAFAQQRDTKLVSKIVFFPFLRVKSIQTWMLTLLAEYAADLSQIIKINSLFFPPQEPISVKQKITTYFKERNSNTSQWWSVWALDTDVKLAVFY